MTAIDEITHRGQHLWLDDISTEMLDDGTIESYRDHCGMTGITANPTIFERAIAAGAYDQRIADSDGDDEEVFWSLAVDDVGRAADLLAPAHETSGGRTGFVSIELSPRLADDADESIRQGVELFDRVARRNVMVKVPGTRAGATAIEELTASGVNVNVTLLFGLDHWEAAHAAYQRGLARRLEHDRPIEVHSVASFFLSRIDRALDDELPDDLRHTVAVDSAVSVRAAWRAALEREPWTDLEAAGAAPQQLLWASTSPKADELPETYYAQRLVAPDTVTTLPTATFDALCELDALGEPGLDDRSAADAQERLQQVQRRTRPLGQAAEQLQIDGVQSFADSFDALLETIAEVRR